MITNELFKAPVDISQAVDKKSKALAQQAKQFGQEKKNIASRFLKAGINMRNAQDFAEAILVDENDSEREKSAESIRSKQGNEISEED